MEHKLGKAYRKHGRDVKFIKNFGQKTIMKQPLGGGNIKMKPNEVGWKVWTGFVQFMMGIDCRLVWTQY
jgi:hypothetical protein